MTGFLAWAASFLVPIIALVLLLRAWPILSAKPLKANLLGTSWQPYRGIFGFLPFIVGTMWVTILAMIITVPPSLLTAIHLAEYTPSRARALIKPLIDLLAGIPSVVYGVWGVLVLVPLVEHTVIPFCSVHLRWIPFLNSENPTGFGVLSGGLVLAVMVFPIIISVSEEVIHVVPQGLREASLALGATHWQTTKHIVLRKALPGVAAAVVLGFSRAFGETMAVMMVVGNIAQLPQSLFDAAYPLTALIANNYGEMLSVPMYDSALLAAALILLVVVLIFNILSRLVLLRLHRYQ
ncbi:MAG: phosphate ABC transporter permease subunit PstC [Anaerolineales bacterium]